MEQNNELIKFLGRLNTLLERGKATYKNYLSEGKILLYAIIIKDNNMRLRELILEHLYLLPSSLHTSAIDIVSHIDTWYELWKNHFETNNFGVGDEFVFENKHTFPKQSEEKLIAYYNGLLLESL